MQRWIPILAAVFCVQLLIAAALFMRKDTLASAPPDAPFVTAAIRDADHIVIEARPKGGTAGTPIDLLDRNGVWVVHSEFDVPADQSKVGDLVAKLAGLRRGLPIADTADALRRFKVAPDEFTRRITLGQGGKTLAKLYFGKSAGLRKSDARAGGEHRVYTVGLATYDVPTDAGAWIDADLLRIPADKIAGVDITGTDGASLTLTRTIGANKVPSPWSAAGLAHGRTLDDTKVSSLVDSIGALHVDAALGTQPNPDWQSDHPAVRLTIKETGGKFETWLISKPKTGDYVVLKSSGHPWYFSLSAALAKPLLDAGLPGALALAPARPHVPGKPHLPAKAHTPPARTSH